MILPFCKTSICFCRLFIRFVALRHLLLLFLLHTFRLSLLLSISAKLVLTSCTSCFTLFRFCSATYVSFAVSVSLSVCVWTLYCTAFKCWRLMSLLFRVARRQQVVFASRTYVLFVHLPPFASVVVYPVKNDVCMQVAFPFSVLSFAPSSLCMYTCSNFIPHFASRAYRSLVSVSSLYARPLLWLPLWWVLPCLAFLRPASCLHKSLTSCKRSKNRAYRKKFIFGESSGLT